MMLDIIITTVSAIFITGLFLLGLSTYVHQGAILIVCICNGLKDKDIQDICDTCKTKQEFTECLRMKMNKEKSCHTCYCDLIKSFEGKSENTSKT